MAEKHEPAISYGHLIDRVFWGLLAGSVMFATSELRDLNRSVGELNQKMAGVIEHMGENDRRNDAQDGRIERLEQKIFSR